ncbi:uncharacterized protein PHALS_08467 [Plasmopara halstedii]|uniref:Uncharacterized protein n=1 Tax=Plasmopara halstedii TaxID=4781 RepID=A0A0P1ABY0_PLAHL|nr:uncharacterized protein PHALS_08467 [Plasmopara halstedii]CEG38389.1 hypothetical protein PHALS_08467 [Plasmopara halstedii]|eukprot:XP_024574758.1 hypothetical protein PHALS_08467 [Plasmopara halstedii]
MGHAIGRYQQFDILKFACLARCSNTLLDPLRVLSDTETASSMHPVHRTTTRELEDGQTANAEYLLHQQSNNTTDNQRIQLRPSFAGYT